MKYYLDTEFNGLGGELLSIALVREDGYSFYAIMDNTDIKYDPWVLENVVPLMYDGPINMQHGTMFYNCVHPDNLPLLLEQYFGSDDYPHVISDWPSDLMYLSAALITGPGTMIDIPAILMDVARVDAYPTPLNGAVQHNALWDALALKHYMETYF